MLLNKYFRFLILIGCIFLLETAFGQIKIGDNAATIEPRAILELESTSKA